MGPRGSGGEGGLEAGLGIQAGNLSVAPAGRPELVTTR